MSYEQQPVSVIDWEVPAGERSTARHDVDAYRGDEREELEDDSLPDTVVEERGPARRPRD